MFRPPASKHENTRYIHTYIHTFTQRLFCRFPFLIGFYLAIVMIPSASRFYVKKILNRNRMMDVFLHPFSVRLLPFH